MEPEYYAERLSFQIKGRGVEVTSQPDANARTVVFKALTGEKFSRFGGEGAMRYELPGQVFTPSASRTEDAERFFHSLASELTGTTVDWAITRWIKRKADGLMISGPEYDESNGVTTWTVQFPETVDGRKESFDRQWQSLMETVTGHPDYDGSVKFRRPASLELVRDESEPEPAPEGEREETPNANVSGEAQELLWKYMRRPR